MKTIKARTGTTSAQREKMVKKFSVPLSEITETERKENKKWLLLANTVAPMFNCQVEEVFFFDKEVNDEQMIVFALSYYEQKQKRAKRRGGKK